MPGPRNKPRRPLALLLRPVLTLAGAREISKDMEQNSEDSMGTKRSAEIHSGEEPELVQREPPGKRSCFAEYRLLMDIFFLILTNFLLL